MNNRGNFVAGGGEATVLSPQLRRYHKSAKPNSEVAIRSTFLRDVRLALLETPGGERGAAIHAIITPLVSWIWIGSALMCAGAMMCLTAGTGRTKMPAPLKTTADNDQQPTPLPPARAEREIQEICP